VDTGAALTPATRSFRALVADDSCASGRSQEELIDGYSVKYGRDVIAINFTAKKLKGFQACPRPSPLWATRTVRLAQPLGTRRLVDTGHGQPGRERFPVDSCPVTANAMGCPASG
jgi:hypothetical protein